MATACRRIWSARATWSSCTLKLTRVSLSLGGVSLGLQKNQQASKLQGAINIICYFAGCVYQGGGGRYHQNCNLLFTEEVFEGRLYFRILASNDKSPLVIRIVIKKKTIIHLLHQGYRVVVLNGLMIPSMENICPEEKKMSALASIFRQKRSLLNRKYHDLKHI